uniref:Uncharacterized protein n=1 Tax=Plectus sambesii TaxID=2011161 RepID=A0A914WVA8_9BILA
MTKDDYDSDDSIPSDPQLNKVMNNLDKTSASKLDDMPVQSDTRWRKVKHILVEGGMGSSCHGIPHIAEAHTTRVIWFWSIILLVFLVAFIYLFYTTIEQYLAYGKTVNMIMGVDEIDFPAVTICNINPYKQSAIENVDALNALLVVYQTATKAGDSN